MVDNNHDDDDDVDDVDDVDDDDDDDDDDYGNDKMMTTTWYDATFISLI